MCSGVTELNKKFGIVFKVTCTYYNQMKAKLVIKVLSQKGIQKTMSNPAGIYMLKVNNRNTRTRSEKFHTLF